VPGSALAGDLDYFHRLRDFRNQLVKQAMQDAAERGLRARAETAWRNRDFRTVVDLYTSLEDRLSHAERTKLACARDSLGAKETK
jgi:hypothetical protein